MGIVLLVSKGNGMESLAEPTGMIEGHPFPTVTLMQPTDAGLTQGVTAVADSRAYAAAVQAITAFLTDTFKRP